MGIANMDDSNYDDTLYQLADLFKVFGDPTRIRILSVLSKQELCVQDIADALSMTQSAISHQLRILKQSALVKFRREGKTIYYSLADDHVATIMAQGLEHVCERLCLMKGLYEYERKSIAKTQLIFACSGGFYLGNCICRTERRRQIRTIYI